MASHGATDLLGDAELVELVATGDDDAFDELYRRHADGAWRLAQAVTGNAHDAADAVSEAFARVLPALRAGRLEQGGAFRGYLYTATRNAGLDALRRRARTSPADDLALDGLPTAAPSPAELVAEGEDTALLAEAFRALPERWRSVLWLTEVEGVPTKDAADQLGLTANGTAQLAVRARAGLRERFLQAHLRTEPAAECRHCVDRLGAYVTGGLSPRDLAKVDQHLAGCDECRARRDELDDLSTSLRRTVLPLPGVLATIAGNRVQATLAAGAVEAGLAPSSPVARLARLATQPPPAAERVLAGAAAGIFALGLVAAGLLGRGDDDAAAAEAHHVTPRPAAVSIADAPPSRTLRATNAARVTTPAPSGRPAATAARRQATPKATTRLARPAPTTGGTTPAPAGTNPVTGVLPPAVESTVGPVVDPITELLTPVTDALDGATGGTLGTATSSVATVVSQVPVAAKVLGR